MVMEDSFYRKDSKLWDQIQSLHLQYLRMDETPEKLTIRSRLQDLLKEYLCKVPHNQKFLLPETENVLYRSAAMSSFTGYRASIGWVAISRYAGNLIFQPWRPEFRTIRTYSGFYQHQIRKNLADAELMFMAMGYKYQGEVLRFEQIVYQEDASRISLDALIAAAECQIMSEVYENVSRRECPVTWMEILRMRTHHVCTTMQCVHAIVQKYRERQQESRNTYYNSNDMLLPQQIYSNERYTNVRAHQLPMTQTFPPFIQFNHNCSETTARAHYCYGCSNGAPRDPREFMYLPQHAAQMKHAAGCDWNMHRHSCGSVPTGQLIEIEPVYDEPDGAVYDKHTVLPTHQQVAAHYAREKANHLGYGTVDADKEESSGTWDYVYRDLESQGLRRNDGLDIANEHMQALTLQRKMEDLKSESYRKNSHRDENKYANEPVVATSVSRHDNTNHPKKSKFTDARVKTKNHHEHEVAITKSSITPANRDVPSKSKLYTHNQLPSEPAISMDNGIKNVAREKTSGKWECRHCTYLNEIDCEICAICAKTCDDIKVPIDDKLEVGGPQCTSCTLVNPREADNCRACESKLRNSATYV